MKNTIVKDTLRDIKKSLGRFMSIFAIVTLGVAFFAGIKQSPIDMLITADKYYDDYNLMDLRIVSTLGLTKEDELAVKNVQGVLGAHVTKSMDVVTNIKNSEYVFKVSGLPTENLSDSNEEYINRAKVVEGRLPEKSGECVIEAAKLHALDIPLGSKIQVSSGNSSDISDSLESTEYTVVGKVQTPYYLSYEKGSSSIGNGKVSSYMMIPESDFKSEIYTDMYVTVDGAKALNSHKDKYFDVVDKVTASLEDLGKDRASLRYETVYNEAKSKIDEGKAEFEAKKADAEKALNEGRAKLDSSKVELDNGAIELKNKESEFKTLMTTSEAQLAEGDKKLADGEAAYNKALEDFNKQKPIAEGQIKAGEAKITEIEAAIAQMETTKAGIENQLKDPTLTPADRARLEATLTTLNATISQTQGQLAQLKQQINGAKAQLAEGERKLNETKVTLDQGRADLASKRQQLNDGKIKAESEFAAAKKTIADGREKLAQAEEEYKTQKTLAEQKLAEGEGKIKDGENALNNINESKWYVLDRNKFYSYVDFKNSADSIDALSKVFPVFFFLVAALVCLTTMTRMVDEQRTTIGTLKALGYSKGAIAFKYIVYALSASFGGSILGLAIGLTLFPVVVFNSYAIMYTLPPIIMGVDILTAVAITLVAISITTFAALSACYKELVEEPSALMRPRAPKNGKRIFLERIPFIWTRIGFTSKVTVRNILRYKKRFFMTVFGIAGCTALILTGFGIKDSIMTIVDKQFGTVYKYQMSAILDKSKDTEVRNKAIETIRNHEGISNVDEVWSESIKVDNKDVEKDAMILSPKDTDNFKDFVNLQNRISDETLNLSDDGVILTEKLAKLLDVKVGDEISITNNKNVSGKVKVIGITENYTFHYVYITPTLYEKTFNTKLDYNGLFAITTDESVASEDKLSSEFMKLEGISGVSFNSTMKNSFNDTIKNLNYVVLILIVSAGSLAFVVLYNLTNVNISERIREIATVKVLGFYDNEVSAYIYRENIILTIIGTISGLGMGIILHRFIMITVEVSDLMFGRSIEPKSFVISAALTVLFSVLVNIAMYYKLKNVKMVESLKSVD